MDLTILFDHRFYRDDDGIIFSMKNYNYEFFSKRYLGVFDKVRIVARVSSQLPRARTEAEATEGNNVEVISLGDWNGLLGYYRKQKSIKSILRDSIHDNTAVTMIIPGAVGSLSYPILMSQSHPYTVEVVGDPYDAFSKGACNHPLRPILRQLMTKRLKKLCAHACAASYVTREALQSRYPCPAYSAGISDVEVQDSSFVDKPRQATEIKRPFTLINVGTMAQMYKAHDVLLDSVSHCVKQGLDLRAVFVGDGVYRAQFEKQADALGIADRVVFTGSLPAGAAVRDELDRADLFVLPSLTEGLPRSMVEAMARAMPCLGSTVGGIPELLPAVDMVAPGDAIALANKITEMANDPTRLASMSARNLTKAKEYRDETLSEQRQALYRHIVKTMQEWQVRRRA